MRTMKGSALSAFLMFLCILLLINPFHIKEYIGKELEKFLGPLVGSGNAFRTATAELRTKVITVTSCPISELEKWPFVSEVKGNLSRIIGLLKNITKITETEIKYLTVTKTVTTTLSTCSLTRVRSWLFVVATLSGGQALEALCQGKGTLALGTYVVWERVGNALEIGGGDQVLPCPASLSYFAKGPETVTVLFTGDLRVAVFISTPRSG